MSLAIGIATRGRPQLVAECAATTLKNCRGDTSVVIVADEDDPTMRDFECPEGVLFELQPRPDSVGEKWNRITKVVDADVYMAMSDYRPQITPGFDVGIMECASVFPDGIGLVCQHMANLSFPVYQAATKRMVDVMGHLYVEYFPYWFVDHWLDDVAQMIGRRVFANGETVIRPRPGYGTQDFREPWLWASLYDSCFKEREEIAERLFSVMDEPQWRKAQLRKTFELIHQRSRILNRIVREMKSTSDFDERYERIRRRGMEKLHGEYQSMEKLAA